MHYNSFPSIRQDPYAFRTMLEEQEGRRCRVLEPGETITL